MDCVLFGAPTRTRTANLLITNQLVQTYLLLLSLILKDTGVIGQEDYLADYTLTTHWKRNLILPSKLNVFVFWIHCETDSNDPHKDSFIWILFTWKKTRPNWILKQNWLRQCINVNWIWLRRCVVIQTTIDSVNAFRSALTGLTALFKAIKFSARGWIPIGVSSSLRVLYGLQIDLPCQV